jgi:transposase
MPQKKITLDTLSVLAMYADGYRASHIAKKSNVSTRRIYYILNSFLEQYNATSIHDLCVKYLVKKELCNGG